MMIAKSFCAQGIIVSHAKGVGIPWKKMIARPFSSNMFVNMVDHINTLKSGNILIYVHLMNLPFCPSNNAFSPFMFGSCGSCGYELNLSSSNRNTSSIGSKYGKSIKRGIISFFNIDDSRFTQVDEIQCAPHFSKHSWGFFRRRTKLLCRKCGNHIGNAHNGYASSSISLVPDTAESFPGTEVPSHTKYEIRIRALQPSSSEESGIPEFA